MIKCKLLGHNWDYYDEMEKHTFPAHSNSHMTVPEFTIDINSHFRICKRCSKKQKKINYFDISVTDWEDCNLNKQESRDRKLKELGI